MIPYFYQFSTPIIYSAARQSILNVVHKYKDNFKEYISPNSTETDNNWFLGPRKMPTYRQEFDKSIIDLLDNITLSCYPVIFLHPPNKTIPRHTDDEHNDRNTVLIFPLQPLDDYPPTFYYDPPDMNQPIAVARFINGNPCLLNTQMCHGLTNYTQVDRINFQICFKEPFDLVFELAASGQLFGKRC